jgi:hypothetical protein
MGRLRFEGWREGRVVVTDSRAAVRLAALVALLGGGCSEGVLPAEPMWTDCYHYDM